MFSRVAKVAVPRTVPVQVQSRKIWITSWASTFQRAFWRKSMAGYLTWVLVGIVGCEVAFGVGTNYIWESANLGVSLIFTFK